MKSSGAFHRAMAMMSAIATLGLSGALEKFGEYRSRGHGRDTHTGRKVNGNKQTNWFDRAPHGGGAREVARRRRQIAAGTLKVNT